MDGNGRPGANDVGQIEPVAVRLRNWPLIGLTFLGAVAIGTILYRFVIHGLRWSGPGSTALYLIMGICLLPIGLMGRSARTPGRLRAYEYVAAIVAGLLGGWGIALGVVQLAGQMPLHVRELPGLTIALPGSAEPKVDGNYSTGRVKIVRPDGSDAVHIVSWEAGSLPDEASLAALAHAMGAVSDGATARPVAPDENPPVGGGAERLTVVGSIPEGAIYTTVFVCGARRVWVMTMGVSSPKLHAEILASARCHPDAAKDAVAGTMPLVLHLPAGWKSQASAPPTMSLVNEAAQAALMVVPSAARTDAYSVEKLIPAVLGGIKGAKLTLGKAVVEGNHPVWHGTITVEGEVVPLIVSVTPCPARGISFILLYIKPDSRGDVSTPDFLLDAHCAVGDEKIPAY